MIVFIGKVLVYKIFFHSFFSLIPFLNISILNLSGQFDVRIPGAHPDIIWPQPVEHLSSQLAIAKIKGIHFEPFRILLEPRVCTG